MQTLRTGDSYPIGRGIHIVCMLEKVIYQFASRWGVDMQQEVL